MAIIVGVCGSSAKDSFAGHSSLYCGDFLAVSFVCEMQSAGFKWECASLSAYPSSGMLTHMSHRLIVKVYTSRLRKAELVLAWDGTTQCYFCEAHSQLGCL